MNNFSLSDQIFFSQRLSLLLNSGISMVEALNMMKNMEKSKHKKKIYDFIIEDIEKGISLSKSIKNLKLKLNHFLIILIQNGEMSGNLSEALIQAHNYLEKKDIMKKKIISSLVYPIFIVLATIAMTLFLILYIFPKIIPLLNSLNIKLPLITRIVQELYQFLISYGLWFILSIVMIFVVLNLIIKKNQSVKYKFNLFTISIPFINKYIKIYMMSSVCNIGEMLFSSGKSLPDMLILSSESSRNIVYKKIFLEIYDESVRGISFSTSLVKYDKLFPPLLKDMCLIGEKTGNMGMMLGHCARIFEQDMENLLKRFSSMIEPVLMIFMGIIVGSIALSIILPVYEITNHLSK